MTTQQELNLRDLWLFMCGLAFSSPELCKLVSDLTPHRDFMPLDVRMLLEGIEAKDSQKVGQWLVSRGAAIKKGVKVPQAIAETLAANHRNRLFEQCTGSMEFIRHLAPGEALAKLKEIAATLEAAGVEVEQPKKETANGQAKAKD